jgi:hypothetical protein
MLIWTFFIRSVYGNHNLSAHFSHILYNGSELNSWRSGLLDVVI